MACSSCSMLPYGGASAALDASDGVMDGKFYGRQILGEVPVYKTGYLGSYGASYGSLGYAGALGGFSSSYPVMSGYETAACGSYGLGTTVGAYPALSASYLGGAALVGGELYGSAYTGAYSTGALTSSACYPTVASYPVIATAPVVACQTACLPPPPPPVQCIEPPPVCVVQQPPQILALPAPCPPPPAPLPPPPSVIHIKDDSGPKIASLQAEIRRLERLLATAKETEAALRGEIQELHTKIEIWAQKDVQNAQLEAELARLREQLMECQRRVVFLEGQRDEAHKHIAFLESQLKAADERIAQMAAHIRNLEAEIANLRMRLEVKQEVHSRTNIHETYKVKTFEMAAKLATMDGTDDGMYNGLPIEVEGEGLYRDLVRAGRRPQANVSLTGRPSSMTTTSETYKVQNFEMAEKLSRMDGNDDGRYNGLPIEIVGMGLYSDVRRSRGGSPARVISGGGAAVISGGAAGGARVVSSGGASGAARTSGSVTTSGGQTYKVSNMEMAAKISRMGGADDGTYKGLPIEVQGLGLYRDLRGKM